MNCPGEMAQTQIAGVATPVGRIGFGCSALGEHGWGQVDRQEMIAAIDVALDCGINLFDVADVYGLGRAEMTLGQALGAKRSRAVIVSKVGVRVEGSKGTFYDSSPAWLQVALDASLKRLGTEYIDNYQLHYWDGVTPLEDVFEVFDGMQRAGKIRTYGVTNINPRELARALGGVLPGGLSTFSMQYNLLDRHFEGDIEGAIRELGLTFLSWGSLAEGLLSAKFSRNLGLPADDRRARYRNFVGPRLVENLGLISQIATASSSLNCPTAVVALRWILDRLPRSIALVGIKSRANIAEAQAALDLRMPAHVRADLDKVTHGRRRDALPGLQHINSAGAVFDPDQAG